MMLTIVFQNMVKWCREFEIELKDWHTGNINFLSTAPPKFYLVDYDKNIKNPDAGNRARMRAGVTSLRDNLTSNHVNEPWCFWVDETRKQITEWWAALEP